MGGYEDISFFYAAGKQKWQYSGKSDKIKKKDLSLYRLSP
jgi:hypothetical protein